MKTKRLIFTTLFTLFAIIASAQVKFGFKESINLSTQSELGMLWDNNNIKTGFTLGAVFDYRLHSTISVQTEINFKKEGLAYETNEQSSKITTKRDYYYYNIPLLVKGRFNEELGLSDNWSVSFYGGPYYSYLHSAENETNFNSITTSVDYEKESNKSDWGAVFGVELARIYTMGELFFDIRYEMGLTDVTKSENIKNKVIGIGVGYRF